MTLYDHTRHDERGGHHHHVDADELVPLERYRREVLARIRPLEPIHLGLLEAHGCVLAEDVVAPADVPGFANSAMDGYAVHAEGVTVGDEMAVVGEIAAGSGELISPEPGEAVRIMTGAPVPPGADAVVPVELAEEVGGRVRLLLAPSPGMNVREAGEDVRAGEVVLEAGRRLGAADIGMCAAVGLGNVLVHPRPRVVVISTGDELAEPDAQQLGPGKIRDSNSYTLTTMAREAGATSYRLPIVRDDRAALLDAFGGAIAHADLVVTSGGVSAGRYDLVKEVLAELGDVRFRKVGMQPGMPQAFGCVTRDVDHQLPCFGLPGNPVSAYVSFEIFVRPAIRRLQGRVDLNRPRITAVLDDPANSPPHKVSFLRVMLSREGDVWHAKSTGAQGSGILRSAVLADGLAEIPAGVTHVEAGERVVVHLLVDPAG
ncbi:MAG: molybdopterin molybdotransferase MoeA [Egibacteraceae bacterium]